MKQLFISILMAMTLNTMAQRLPFQDPTLPVEQRVEDLLSRLTLDEKVSLMMNGSPAIDRLGIPQFNWWSEALHGVGRNGLSTVFPSCIGMACSFDEELVGRIYEAVSDEARAKNTEQRRQGKPVGRYQGLSFWTPNINIFRDPRWGRGQETYGEDVLLNARMGLRVVRGLQGNPGSKYYKLHACAKHFAVHSGPEKTRHQFNIEDLPARDLYETYLPAFQYLVQEGHVQQIMCAYQRFEGDPCCGSNRLLQHILRDEWGFQGLVVSDCGAVSDFWRPNRHGVSADGAGASAKAVLSGTDVECGSDYRHLPEAVRRGDISEDQINVSVRRLLRGRFELGDFDDDSLVSWTQIPISVVASPAHKQLALQMGREQMVLLQNKGNLLPLSRNDASRIMVMGPNAADSTMLWGIYFGQPSHTVTLLEGIQAKVGPVKYCTACDITSMTVKEMAIGQQTETADGSTTLQMIERGQKTYTIDEILEQARESDIIIFIGGISPNLEKEQARVNVPGFDGGDRTSIELPQVQRDILHALHNAGKKIVLINCSGSAVALAPETETCDAIIQAWYAGEQGGHALADVLFGDYNPSGKLSVTFYRDDSQLPAFDDYHMNGTIGRTYRYFRGQPLYPFGFGLSYTTFSVCTPQYQKGDASSTVTCTVSNTGSREGTEIVQVYMRRPADTDGPLKTLCAYQRVDLRPGQSQQITIQIPHDRFKVWDSQSNSMRVIPGTYELMVGTSSADSDLTKFNIQL